MNIEQLYYTRLEGGWGIAASTEGINETIKSVFQSIVAQNPTDKELLTLDFGAQGVFLTKSIPAGLDQFGRNKFFAHGYYFNKNDFPILFSEYDRFLSIQSFSSSENEKITSIESLPERCLKADLSKLDIKLTQADEIIEMDEAPGTALRKKRNSSIKT